jgi:hypothetical protein
MSTPGVAPRPQLVPDSGYTELIREPFGASSQSRNGLLGSVMMMFWASCRLTGSNPDREMRIGTDKSACGNWRLSRIRADDERLGNN